MSKIALIKKNKINEFTCENLIQAVKDNVEIIDSTNLMEDLVRILKLNNKTLADTEICYETKHYIYQLVHIPATRDTDFNMDNLNTLSSYILSDRVFGDAILLKLKVQKDYTCKESNIELKDIEKLARNVVKHTYIKITTDGKVTEGEYEYDPVNILPTNTYSPIELNTYGFNLLVYVNINFEGKQLNEKASRLAGSFFILDDVYIVSRHKNGFGNFTKKEYNDLEPLTWIPYTDRVIKQEKEKEKVNNKTTIFNRFIIMKEIAKKYKNELEKEHNWDKFYKTIGQSMPINYEALQKSIKGEPTV